MENGKLPQDEQVSDSQKMEFRKYIEQAGIVDAFTKVLVNLYELPEKPSDPLKYIQGQLDGGAPDTVDVMKLKSENSKLQEEVEKLKIKVDELTSHVEQLQTGQKEEPTDK